MYATGLNLETCAAPGCTHPVDIDIDRQGTPIGYCLPHAVDLTPLAEPPTPPPPPTAPRLPPPTPPWWRSGGPPG